MGTASKQALRRHILVDLGDDAAVLRSSKHPVVVCCDMLVEDVDFRQRWASAADVGHKAAAVNLSDLAAMGACPAALIIALAAPKSMAHTHIVRCVIAADKVGRSCGAPVIGGDLSSTCGPWVVSVTALGWAHQAPLKRNCAEIDDVICVLGSLGAAAAGLVLLEGQVPASTVASKDRSALIRAQLRPTAQVELGQALALSGVVHSAADISDGLIKDAGSLLAPGQGAVLVIDALPIAHGVSEVAAKAGKSASYLALTGGEDFVLVVALAPKNFAQVKKIAAQYGARLTAVGRVERGRGVRLHGAYAHSIRPSFEHF